MPEPTQHHPAEHYRSAETTLSALASLRLHDLPEAAVVEALAAVIHAVLATVTPRPVHRHHQSRAVPIDTTSGTDPWTTVHGRELARDRHRPGLRRHPPPGDPAHRTAACLLPHPDHSIAPRPRGRLGPRRGPRRHDPLARLEELPAPSHLFWIGPPGPTSSPPPATSSQPSRADSVASPATTQPRHHRNEPSTNIKHGALGSVSLRVFRRLASNASLAPSDRRPAETGLDRSGP
jgi:hypothetical protein